MCDTDYRYVRLDIPTYYHVTNLVGLMDSDYISAKQLH